MRTFATGFFQKQRAMKKDTAVYIRYIDDCTHRIETYVTGASAAFLDELYESTLKQTRKTTAATRHGDN